MDRIVFATGPIAHAATRRQPRRLFATMVSEMLGVEIAVVVAPTYNELGGLMHREEAHVAWLPPAIFARTFARGEAQLLLATVRKGGARFRGAFFVRASAEASSIEELAGKRAAWVDRDSCSGYLYPRLALLEAGVDPRTFFGRELFLGTHEHVARAVEVGAADVGATFIDEAPNGGNTHAGWSLEVGPDAMRALLTTSLIPADTICVGRTLGSSVRDAVADALLRLHDTEDGREVMLGLFGAERFAHADPTDYDPIHRALALS
jgi:phosphonate transport system substrate-binding protein